MMDKVLAGATIRCLLEYRPEVHSEDDCNDLPAK